MAPLRGWTLQEPAPQIAGEPLDDVGWYGECGLLALKSHHSTGHSPRYLGIEVDMTDVNRLLLETGEWRSVLETLSLRHAFEK